MKTDGIDLIEGSEVVNLTVDTGTAFPASPTEGEMFFRTDGGSEGLYVYASSTWARVAQTTEVAPTVHDHDTVYVDVSGDNMTGDLAMGSNNITGLADGVASGDAVNKGQLDAAQAGILVKEQCRVATTAALPTVVAAGSGVGKTLTASAVGVLTVDGVATVLGDRILVKNQAAGVDNGFYDVTTEGTAGVAFVLTRSTDFDGTPSGEVQAGNFSFINEGTENGKSGWALLETGLSGGGSPVQGVVDTDTLSFSQFQGLPAYTAGNQLSLIGDEFAVVEAGLDADLWDGGHKTISTSDPSGGADGDVWFKYLA